MRTTPCLVSSLLITALVLSAPSPLPAQRSAVETGHGMVVSVQELASHAGVEILQKGGNAVKDKYGQAFYEEIGHKGGQKVKRLIEEAKRSAN